MDIQKLKTIIAGSRTITDWALLYVAINWARVAEGIEVTEVISGNARGVDQLGELYAEKYNLPLHKYPADWKTYGKSAGMIRNKEMLQTAEALIAIWDGNSRGTKNMIEIAKKAGLKVYVYRTDDNG